MKICCKCRLARALGVEPRFARSERYGFRDRCFTLKLRPMEWIEGTDPSPRVWKTRILPLYDIHIEAPFNLVFRHNYFIDLARRCSIPLHDCWLPWRNIISNIVYHPIILKRLGKLHLPLLHLCYFGVVGDLIIYKQTYK